MTDPILRCHGCGRPLSADTQIRYRELLEDAQQAYGEVLVYHRSCIKQALQAQATRGDAVLN